jgi:hypothetical protein
MHAKDDVPVAVGASDLQTDRISRSGEPSLSPAAASSFPPQSRATRSATTLFPFQIRGRVYRYGAKNLHIKMWYISHRRNTNVSNTVERCHLQPNFNISNHTSSRRRSHITNLFSPCPKVSGTTPKTYRSWSRKRITSRALGTLNVTLSLPRNCANRRLFNCLWYEERPPLQIIKITCRISSAKSSTVL